jgi:cobalt-zinc-cadmium efflux system outer membrane protein
MKNISTHALVVVCVSTLLTAMGGCTMMPRGAGALNRRAREEGAAYRAPAAMRNIPALPKKPDVDELVSYALVRSPQVEAAYWRFRAALEKIPQAGTQMTTPMLSGGAQVTNGSVGAGSVSLGIANMGSSDIRWPTKPATDAKIAFQRARAAGQQFRGAQFLLRQEVLTAWYQLIATRQLIRDAQRQISMYKALAEIAKVRLATDRGSTVGTIHTLTEISRMKLKLSALRREEMTDQIHLNLLLNRQPHIPILTPAHLPTISGHLPVLATIIRQALRRNPGLLERRRLLLAAQTAVQRAKMQYIPNFDLGATTSLDGTMQNLSAAIMFPVVRYRAIHASIHQAMFDVFQAESRIYGNRNQLEQRLAVDLVTMRNDGQQVALIDRRLLPRLHQMKNFSSVSVEQGGGGLASGLKYALSAIQIERLRVGLKLDWLIRKADLEAAVAAPLQPVRAPLRPSK